MLVIGLTGSIGMGKSTAALQLKRLGLPVYDADATIHSLSAAGGAAIPAIRARFPQAVHNGAVDRSALGAIVFADRAALKDLEKILHPLARRLQRRFLARNALAGRRRVVLDIPLLFETGGERRCDLTVVVTAPAFLQRQRVLRRPGMTEAKLDGILARQTPDAEKRRRADLIVPTGQGKRYSLRVLRKAATASGGKRVRRPTLLWIDHA
ncbi:MAG: dephospho-CoA kinase [Elsteraceae bacterium]